MDDRWTIWGREYGNCNCSWGCPCQFGAKTTHGHCEAVVCGRIDEGHFNETSLDGLNWALLLYWPGEIADGNGTQQVIIDQRADPAQREGLRKILHGESTTPGATHFFVYNSTMSTVLDTLYAPIELSIDIDQRLASLKVEGLVESRGTPIISAHTGKPVRSRIDLPNGFEYSLAEMGNGTTTARAGIELHLKDSYGQFNLLHLNCRAPAHFLSRHWRSGPLGAFRMGVRLGAYCLGCCWILMGLLFIGGVMNLLWIAAIAAFVLLEKTMPFGVAGARAAGAAMILIGALSFAA